MKNPIELLSDTILDALLNQTGAETYSTQPTMSQPGHAHSEWMAYHLFDGSGVDCPVCGRFTKLYARAFEGQWVVQLYHLYEDGGAVDSKVVMMAIPTTMVDASNGMRRTFQLMRHWGLIKGVGESSYQITEAGCNFVTGKTAIPEIAVLYDNDVVFTGGRSVYWYDVVHNRFSMSQIMDQHTLQDAGIADFLKAIPSTATPKDLLAPRGRKNKTSRPIDYLIDTLAEPEESE